MFGLEAYIHSGVKLSLSYEGNYPDRAWDVSQLGFVLVSKKEARTRNKARTLAIELLETWNAILEGSVYGYVVEKDGRYMKSCWGFIGTECSIEKTYVLKEARDIVDTLTKNALKAHIQKVKAYIKQHVPLEKRQSFV
jgi:hypothetical protein